MTHTLAEQFTMTPQQQIARLSALQRKIKKSYLRAISTTRRNLSSKMKKEMVQAIPKLKQGLNAKVNIKRPVTKTPTSASAIIAFKPNQPNARRFVSDKVGTWSRLNQQKRRPNGRPRRRILTPNGGLFINKPNGGRVFIKGAFFKKIKNHPLALVWKRIPGTDKIKAVRGYTSAGLVINSNRQIAGFLRREFGRKGIIMLEREYRRQMEVP